MNEQIGFMPDKAKRAKKTDDMVRVDFRLPVQVNTVLEELALRWGLSVSETVRFMVMDSLSERGLL